MKENRSFSHGCVLGILSILLGICLTAGTAFYQRSYYPVCHGGLSAGFPIVFLCDGSGGSPIGITGRIDIADWSHVNPMAFLLDFLLYSALLSLTWSIVSGLMSNGLFQNENFRWGVLLSIGYLAVFLFAFMSFQSHSLNIELSFPRTPTPYIFSPTSIGTMSPPQSTTVPTTGP